MIALVVQTVLLIAIAFILGCVAGCLLRSLFGSGDRHQQSRHEAATAAAAIPPVAHQNSPAVPEPPIPVAPVQPAESPRVETPPAAFAAAAPTDEPAKPKKTKSTKPRVVLTPEKTKETSTKRKMVAAAAKPDNLKLIRGIGPQNEARLNGLGVNSFAQIASWTKGDQAHFSDVLAFPGRIEREEWVSQAKMLAKGGTTDFSKRVKQGTVKSSTGSATPVAQGTKPNGLLRTARGEKADNLTLIDGVGNALEKKLFKLGIYHFDQIAIMSNDELNWLGHSVGFPGRPERENWAGESKVLATGGTTEHAKRVERGQIKTSRKSDE